MGKEKSLQVEAAEQTNKLGRQYAIRRDRHVEARKCVQTAGKKLSRK